jgi:hypothetical protein
MHLYVVNSGELAPRWDTPKSAQTTKVRRLVDYVDGEEDKGG